MSHVYKEVLKINDVAYSMGPFGYACYFHPRKHEWEISASISNKKLTQMLHEQTRIEVTSNVKPTEEN